MIEGHTYMEIWLVMGVKFVLVCLEAWKPWHELSLAGVTWCYHAEAEQSYTEADIH